MKHSSTTGYTRSLRRIFPKGIARNLIDKFHQARNLEVGQAVATEVNNLLLLTGFAGYDHRLDHMFAEIAGNANYDHFLHFGKCGNDGFDFHRIYFSACTRNQPRRPPLGIEITAFVLAADIARPEDIHDETSAALSSGCRK